MMVFNTALIALVLTSVSALTHAQTTSLSPPAGGLEWFNRGNDLFRNNQYAEAVKAYNEVIRLRSPLAPMAYIYAARTERNAGHLEQAAIYLIPLQNQRLPSGISRELQREKQAVVAALTQAGLSPYRKREYDTAYSLLSKAATLETNSEAALLAATALSHLNRIPEAISLLERFTANCTDTPLCKEGLALLDEFKNTRQTGSYLSFAVAGGFAANVFSAPDGTATESKAALRTSVDGAWRTALGPGWSMKPALTFFHEELAELPDRRVILNSISLETTYHSSNWNFEITPYGQLQVLGTSLSIARPGGRASIDHSWGPITLRIGFDMSSPAYAFYSYLSGPSYHRSIGLEWRNETWSFSTALNWSYENIGDLLLETGLLPLKNEAWTPSIRMDVSITDDLRVSWENLYSLRDYTTLSEPNAKARDDRRFSSALQLSASLSRAFDLGLIGEWTLNRSTLDSSTDVDNKNFRQGAAFVQLKWKVLP